MTETEAAHEQRLVDALRARDESAFAELVDRHTPMMLRVARGYVASREVAEEVVQETWIALLEGIDRFEGRSTLRTWLFRILVNIARNRGVRERHYSEAALAAAYAGGATVDAARFRPESDPQWPRHWANPPSSWPDSPEGSVLGAEILDVARRELEQLPSRQRMVVAMRDVLGYDAEEVCTMLSITTANQRVLLHRGRAGASGTGRLPGGRIVSAHPLDCQELVELVTAYLDGALTAADRAQFETHLHLCRGCANYLEQMERTVRALGSLPADELDPAFRDRLLTAFREWR